MVWSARGLGRTGSGFGLTSAALGGRRLRTPGGGGLSGPRRSAGPSRSRRAGTVGGTRAGSPVRVGGGGTGAIVSVGATVFWLRYGFWRCHRFWRRARGSSGRCVGLGAVCDRSDSGGGGRGSSTGDPELGCPRAVSGPRSTEPGASLSGGHGPEPAAGAARLGTSAEPTAHRDRPCERQASESRREQQEPPGEGEQAEDDHRGQEETARRGGQKEAPGNRLQRCQPSRAVVRLRSLSRRRGGRRRCQGIGCPEHALPGARAAATLVPAVSEVRRATAEPGARVAQGGAP